MKHYRFLMSLGWFAVIFNASLFVFNVFHGADINKLLCNFFSAISPAFAMIVCYQYNRLEEILVAEYKEKCADFEKRYDNAVIDHLNLFGYYNIFESRNAFFVSKCMDGREIFIVRSFAFTIGDDTSRKKARLRAYSLLNHITDNGKLWRSAE